MHIRITRSSGGAGDDQKVPREVALVLHQMPGISEKALQRKSGGGAEMTSTVIGKFDYEGDEARIEGDSVTSRKMIAKVAAFLKARPLKGKNVVAQIIEKGDKAGWIEHVQEVPLESDTGYRSKCNQGVETTVTGTFKGINKFNQIGIEDRKGIHTIGVSPELLAREKENFGTNVGFQATVVITGQVATDIKWTGPGPQQHAPTAKEILEKNIKDAAPAQPKQETCTSPAAAAPVQKAEELKKDEWGEEFKRFKDLLSSVKRDGIPEFLQYLIDKTDFFVAPSSTKYHDAREGGLLHHSLTVYDNLTALSKIYTVDIPEESRILISLLHDVCKTKFYRLEKKQLPRKNENGDLVYDDFGRKIWDETLVWTIDDQFPCGHGEKSTILILQHGVKLTDEEIMAIRWHMMAYDDVKNSYAGNLAITNASDRYRLIPLVHMADLAASFLEMREPEPAGGA